MRVGVRLHEEGSITVEYWDVAPFRVCIGKNNEAKCDAIKDFTAMARMVAVLKILPVGGKIEGFGKRTSTYNYELEINEENYYVGR